MQVSQIIKPSAVAVRITEVVAGSVYKRLDKPSYGEPRLVFGVVTDVLHDGESAAITAVEFTQDYAGGDVTPKIKAFGGDTDVAFFPATPEEFQVAMAEAITSQTRTVEAAERDLRQKQAVLDRLTRAADEGITAPATASITA